MDTNAVLSIAFSIIANFTNVVYVPPQSVPQSINDLEAYQIGRRFFPLDMYLRHKRGTEFWIRAGAVATYETPGDYYGLQDPELISKFIGTAKLSSNQVFELATSTVRRLIKNGDPLTNIVPVVRVAKSYHGQPIPSYDITWPNPINPKVFSVTRVDVDARYGLIVFLGLHDPGFDDPVYAQQISNQVYKAESPNSTAVIKTNPPPIPQ